MSYAVFGIFGGGEREIMKKNFPGINFIEVRMEKKLNRKRYDERGEKIKKESGMTEQQFWDSDEMAEARKMFGPKFSRAASRKFEDLTVFNPKLIDIPLSEPDCYHIYNNDFKNLTGVKQLNTLVGLEFQPVDSDAVAQVNYVRFQKMMELMAKNGEAMKEAEKKEE